MEKVKVIRKGEMKLSYCEFEELREGDTFFVNGTPHVAVEDAHYSGDASYDGYLIHDDVDGWFPEELDKETKVKVIRNGEDRVSYCSFQDLQNGDKFFVNGTVLIAASDAHDSPRGWMINSSEKHNGSYGWIQEELDTENDKEAFTTPTAPAKTDNYRVHENIVNIAIMAANLVAEGRAELDDYEGFTGFTQAIIQMAKDFETENADVDFNDGNRDYWEEIDQYAREKLLERYGVEEQKPGAEIKVIMDRGCVQTVLKNSDLNVHVEIISCDPDYDDNEKLQAYAEEIQDDSEFRDCDYHVAAFQEGTPESPRFCYYEVCVSPDNIDSIHAKWMVVKALSDQEPDSVKLEAFLRDYDSLKEGERVCFAMEIEEDAAREQYDFEDEDLWPVFGRNTQEETEEEHTDPITIPTKGDAEDLVEIKTPERITADMVRVGYSTGIITLEVNPDAAGVVCRIGDHWFYFGGETAESYRSADAFKKDVPEEDIIREIYDALDGFYRDADTFEYEYAYYFFYLQENLSSIPVKSNDPGIRLYYGYEDSDDYGVSLSFRVVDPATVDEARVIDELAAELDVSQEDHHFHWNSIDITLPESVIARIKA